LTDTADGIAVSGVALKTGLEGGLSAELSLGAIESLARPALFAPLTLDATTKGGAFDASLSDKRGLFVFEAKGDMSTQGGKADLTLYPVTFLSGAMEVADVSPRLALLLSGVKGTVGFKGHAGWGKDGLKSEGTLSMSDLGGSYGSIVAAGIDGDIAFSSLFPLATKGPQTVTVAAIAAGLPLSDGRIVIEEKAGENLTVGPVDFNMAGGTLHADPFMADLTGGGDTRFVVDAENVDLNQVIAYADIDGLTGTGTLSGRIPVKFGANGFSVDGGGLAAIRQGELHYRPAVLPGFLQGDDLRAQMLRDVLQNFQYSNLSVGLTGGTGGEAEQEVKLSAKGGNPDFLDGHPVELNVTFKGALLDALMSAADITGASALERLYKADQGGQQQEGSKTQ
jgi:hypothetical protein